MMQNFVLTPVGNFEIKEIEMPFVDTDAPTEWRLFSHNESAGLLSLYHKTKLVSLYLFKNTGDLPVISHQFAFDDVEFLGKGN